MKQVFKYSMMGSDANLDTIVSAFSKQADLAMAGKNTGDDYEKANFALSESIVKYTVEKTGGTYTGLEMVKNPMVVKSPMFKDTFATLLAQAITPAIPKITSSGLSPLYEVFQSGFGDNAVYTVQSNELFVVNDHAEGIRDGGFQTTFNDERTITATKRNVTAGIPWYQLASGKFDWGYFGAKVVKAYDLWIQAAIVKALGSVVTDEAGRIKHGLAGYYAAGLSDANWMTLSRNVKNANGGAQVYALGTGIALAGVLPTQAGFRFSETSDIVKVGYLPDYKSVPLVEIDNAMIPYTQNTATPAGLVQDNFILMLALGAYKPVKVLFEGNSVEIDYEGIKSVDNTMGLSIAMRIGVDVVVGDKFGIIVK